MKINPINNYPIAKDQHQEPRKHHHVPKAANDDGVSSAAEFLAALIACGVDMLV